MADRRWIERIVNTEGRPCPLLRDVCPGSRRGCAFWVEEMVSDGQSRDVQGGCLVAYQYVIQHEIVLESVRTQAGIDKAASQVRQTAGALGLLAARSADRVRGLEPGDGDGQQALDGEALRRE